MALIVDNAEEIFRSRMYDHVREIVDICSEHGIPMIFICKLREHTSETDTAPLYAYDCNAKDDDELIKKLDEAIQEDSEEVQD